jgi:hypothetical protein
MTFLPRRQPDGDADLDILWEEAMFVQKFRASSPFRIIRAAVPAAVIAMIGLAINACGEQDPATSRVTAPDAAAAVVNPASGTFYGATVALGPGNARTYVTIENGIPTELGVELNEGALQGLPTAGEHDGHNNMQHMMESAWDLPLPAQAVATAYKSVYFGWMPMGHGAPYDRPHFDFHFYVVPTAERLAIDVADAQWAQKAAALPSQEYWPARYFPLNLLINKPAAEVTVPGMGLHWLDVAAPELHGAEFRYTLFYGSWNGRIIFDEPMITKAVLESRESIDVTLPPAARYASEGFRAGGYRVYFDQTTQRHRVALTQLTRQ